MRILVLVLGARVAPYPLLMRVIERTWASVDVAETEVLFYRGGSATRLRGRHLELPVGDDLPNVGRKTLACFDHVLEHRRFDVVFRTNCSSYVDLPNLRRFADATGRVDAYYAGSVAMHEGSPFASGSGYFLSRDLVQRVVSARSEWNHAVLDDVALGAQLARFGVSPEPLPRRDYRHLGEVVDVDTTQFHFRCRTDSWRRLEDARIMIALHRAFCDARGVPAPAELRALGAAERLARSALSQARRRRR
ncbi:MAG TPA: hypothetical protein VFA19_05080 [Gaiellaceae bacterium]|nr:hypothetical protein [Gaiellaceae bacterium]